MKYITMHPSYRFCSLRTRILLVSVTLLALSACGQKGPLTLPQPQEAVAEEPVTGPENPAVVIPTRRTTE